METGTETKDWEGLLRAPQGRLLLDLLDGDETRAALKAAFADICAGATYWQPQHNVVGESEVPRLEGVLERCVERGVFDVLDWEWDPEEQWWAYERPWERAAFHGAADWDAWRGEMKAWEAEARTWEGQVSACWWSAPPTAETGPMTWLRDCEEDGTGPSELRSRMVASDDVKPLRRYEIDSAEDYVRLVARYPLEMSAYRRHDWGAAVGARGRLLSPDFAAMVADWDAVTMTPRGYLLAAARALEVPGIPGAQTVAAGWHPGRTWWLTDQVRVSDTELRWVRPDVDGATAWEPRDTRG